MFKFECYLSSLARALFSFCFFIQSIYMKHSGIWNTLPQVDNYPRWFHLQASEMVLFVTITIPNIVFYWAMVLHVQFLPMNFFFFCVNSLLSPSHYLEILSKYNHIYIMADNIDRPKKSIH